MRWFSTYHRMITSRYRLCIYLSFQSNLMNHYCYSFSHLFAINVHVPQEIYGYDSPSHFVSYQSPWKQVRGVNVCEIMQGPLSHLRTWWWWESHSVWIRSGPNKIYLYEIIILWFAIQNCSVHNHSSDYSFWWDILQMLLEKRFVPKRKVSNFQRNESFWCSSEHILSTFNFYCVLM